MGTSDDNNHDIVKQDFVYMRIYSNIHTVAFYYSLDNKDWQVVRLYKNNYPEKVFVGISNQCPRDKGSFSHFEGLSLSTESLSDIRMPKSTNTNIADALRIAISSLYPKFVFFIFITLLANIAK